MKKEWIKENFGQGFIDDLMRAKCGFHEIPAGDFKESHLSRYPDLLVKGAPKIFYKQENGMNLCVPNALASVLHVLGFKPEAKKSMNLEWNY